MSAPDFDLNELAGIPDPDAQASLRHDSSTRVVNATISGPTRQSLHRRQWVCLLLACLWFIGHTIFLGLRGDFAMLPGWYLVSHAGLPMLLGLMAVCAAVRKGREGLGTPVALLGGLLVFALLVFWAAAFLLPAHGMDAPEPAATVRCLDVTVAWVCVPVLLAAYGLRGTFVASARWRSAAMGGGFGLFAGGLMNLHCGAGGEMHLAIGHGLPAVLATLAGALLVARATRVA